MKRYMMDFEGEDHEDDNGAWVLWEDVETVLKRNAELEAQSHNLIREQKIRLDRILNQVDDGLKLRVLTEELETARKVVDAARNIPYDDTYRDEHLILKGALAAHDKARGKE